MENGEPMTDPAAARSLYSREEFERDLKGQTGDDLAAARSRHAQQEGRMLELASNWARERHDNGEKSTSKLYGAHDWHFDTCNHPDCEVVRTYPAALAAARLALQQENEKLRADVEEWRRTVGLAEKHWRECDAQVQAAEAAGTTLRQELDQARATCELVSAGYNALHEEVTQLRQHLLDVIPTSWLDPVLTGPDAVIGKPPYDRGDIERLLSALQHRVRDRADRLARRAPQLKEEKEDQR